MMKDLFRKLLHNKLARRVVSMTVAFFLLLGTIPIGFFREELEELGLTSIDVLAADEYDFPKVAGTNTVSIMISQLVEYSIDCENHRDYHKDDDLVITNQGNTSYFASGFRGLGSYDYPFEGSVKIKESAASDKVLNLDAPLFNYVYDDVVISNDYGTDKALNISRVYNSDTTSGASAISTRTPILAKNVIHKDGGTPATWNINVCTPSAGGSTLQSFGGIIGTMEAGASLTVGVKMNQGTGDTDAVTVTGEADLGFACGKMLGNSILTFSLSTNRGVGNLTTTTGNVGGLVGSMAEGSSFTYTGGNPQTVTAGSKDIKTSASGYAGGVVGKNDKGTVTLNTDSYLIGQKIEGKSGAGSIYGYYSPGGTGDVAIDTGKYTVSDTVDGNTYNCQVNGTGHVGGLIGELVCTNNITISGSGPVNTSHASTKATNYGGLIGKYKNDAAHTLTVGTISISTANAGTSDYYGGCVGTIDTTAASYAVFNNPTITSANAGTLTYGGLVASADNAFIDVNGANITASRFKGGGLVGCLDHGVIRMDGTINLIGAVPDAPTKNSTTDETDKVGKIVGWRDDALVFAKSTCTLNKPDATVDDIGAWGQVIMFSAETSETVPSSGSTPAYTETVEKLGGTEVLRVNENSHVVSIAAPSDTTSHYQTIASISDFAKTALCFQIDASKNSFVRFSDETDTYSTICDKDITLSANVVLTGSGFTGLTRDNDIGSAGVKCTYTGTFNGKPASTVNKITFGGETVYRHAYNGLIGIANGASIVNTEFDGTISVNALEDMYVGSAAAAAQGDFTTKGLKVETTINHAGTSKLSVGGVLGEALSGIGNITIGATGDANRISANATITTTISEGSSGDVCLGGVVGKIAKATNSTDTWTFTNVDIAGSITNTSSLDKNQVGGLVAVISGFNSTTTRTLNLNSITIKDLSISVSANSNGTVGGVLGYAWQSVNTNFDDVFIGTQVQTGMLKPTITQTNDSATGVDFAGLVYNGTGHWTLTSANDLKINAFGLSSDNAQSFGMIVNKAWTETDSKIGAALYLDLQAAGAYSITSANVSFKKTDSTFMELYDIPDFDELVAYSAYYTGSGASKGHYSGGDNLYVTQNGQAVISIGTGNEHGGLTMDGSTASGTYTPATTYGQQMNPHSRYYYNLHTLKDSTSGADGLMSWGAKWYAHDTIKTAVSSNSWGTIIPDGTYNMQGYSWYPLNIDSSTVSLNGTFKLYNKEFEGSENYVTTTPEAGDHVKRTSLYDGGTTQHYLMQSALFNNVGGKLNVGTVTLQGSVPQIVAASGSKYSGALVRGTVKGSGATEAATAKVTTTDVVLDGICVYNFDQNSNSDYAPLLINKSADYSTLTIHGVRVASNAYGSANTNVKTIIISGSSFPKAATSLIGNVGVDKNSKNVNVNFTNIRLDGRNELLTGTGMSNLNDSYHTSISLFTKATLLNQLTFDTGKGTYTYNYEEDWDNNSHDANHCVTYGKEVGYTTADTTTQYPGQERWYLNTNDTGYYTDPISPTGDGTYASTFVNSYLPYVFVPYDKENHLYQLEVNHASSRFDGCGTYNDPYTITSGADFETINIILATSNDGNPGNVTISIPKADATNIGLTTTWHDSAFGHTSYSYLGADSNNPTEHPAGYYANGVYGDKTDANEYLTPEQVRTYVAGAYYLVSPANNGTTITISGDTFLGLGNTTDSYAQFRGVIVGSGNEYIVNKTDYPLIAISNGSVVKDLNIVVDKNTAAEGETPNPGNIELTQETAEAFPSSKSYGSVIGAVLGGDNIIDNVTVTFQNTTITLSGEKAQLIPVGGYIGVIEKGGVIFRGMEDNQSGISGIPAGVVTAGITNGEMTSETNMRWIYVNPIIGRVINGYAVTEASAYRPYENGIRTYHGGAHTNSDGTEVESELVREYWAVPKSNPTATPGVVDSDTYSSSTYNLQPVTMKNGNKHYSITDIKTYVDGDGRLNTNGSAVNVEVPNGQSFFIMSLIVNSGMSDQKLGYNGDNQISRSAMYNHVTKDLSAVPSDVLDYDNLAKNDTRPNSSTKRGYLMSVYTTGDTNIAGTNKTLKLTTANTKYILPDGYKGVGNMYDQSAIAAAGATFEEVTTDNGDNDPYRMKITNFDGNGATISMNSSWYYYMDDTNGAGKLKLFDTEYHHHLDVGFGLFNYQNGTTSGTTNRYYNFILTGNVVTDCIDSNSTTGAHITYTGNRVGAGYNQPHYVMYDYNTNPTQYNPNDDTVGEFNGEVSVDGDFMVSAGGLMGTAMAGQYIERVALQNVYVHGIRYSGGLIGLNPSNGAFTYLNSKINNEALESNKIKIRGASTCGGMIGKNQNAIINIDNGKASYSITEVVSECTRRDGVNNSDYNYGVGGFIGACRTENINVNIKNIVVGDENQSSPSHIRADSASIFAGGMIGVLNRGRAHISDCDIYNQSVSTSSISGGLIGYYTTATAACDITCVKVYAKDYESAEITNPIVSSVNDFAGGFIGATKDVAGLTIKNSSVEGYTISSAKSAGGAVGNWTKNTLALQNVEIYECDVSTKNNNTYAGGLVGDLSGGNLYGYNILVKNNDLAGKAGSGSILGNRADASLIKIAGFSRQDDRDATHSLMSQKNVYKPSDTYGNGGYVVFADYNDNASTDPNVEFSNILEGVANVASNVVDEPVPDGSKTTTTIYEVSGDNPESTSVTITDGDITSGPTSVDSPDALPAAELGTNYSGTILKYDIETVNATSVSDFAGTNSRADYGFKIYLDDHTTKKNNITGREFLGPYYLTSSYDNSKNGLNLSQNDSEAATWYREVNPSNSNKIKLWTYVRENGEDVANYIKADGDTNISLVTDSNQGTYFTIAELPACEYTNPFDGEKYTDDLTDSFSLSSTGTIFLQFSNGGGCVRLYKSAPDTDFAKVNYAFRFEYVRKPDNQLQALDYNTVSNSNGTVTFSGNPTTIRSRDQVTQAERDAYSAAHGSDITKVYYYVAKTENVNKIKQGENIRPYVTTSPRTDISATQWLTGDGQSSTDFTKSNFTKIVSDTTNKQYTYYKRSNGDTITNANLTDVDKSLISDHYSSTTAIYGDVSGMRSIPLLVVDDTDNAKTTAMINNYINVLANTKYNYAQANANVYNVSLHSCVWNGEKWTVDSENTASLKTTTSGGNYFTFNPDKVDTGSTPKFSLMDIQYYDPSNATGNNKKIAYHLYIPVYVNRLLRYKFTASLASNTDYYLSAYNSKIDYLFENLGNPVTMEFEYEYIRTPSEWAQYVNEGGSVLTNYYKSLILHKADCFPDGTKLVLVDASNMDKYYYLDTMPSGTTMDLHDFIAEDRTTHYAPAPLQNLMSFTAMVDNDNGNLVIDKSESGRSKAVIQIGSDYYRLYNSETDSGLQKYKVYANVDVESDNAGNLVEVTSNDSNFSKATIRSGDTYYRPVDDGEELPEGTNKYSSESFSNERYYLSFFTTHYETDEIFDIEIQTVEEFAENKTSGETVIWEVENWRPNKIATNGNKTVHLLLGDFYENTLDLEVVPMDQVRANKQCLDEENYFLTVTMTSHIQLKGAVSRQEEIASNMRGKTNSPIYQTFLMSYDKQDADGNKELGIDLRANGSIMKDNDSRYYGIIAGMTFDKESATNITDDEKTEYIDGSESFVELRNGQNIISYLADSAHDYAVSLQVSYDMLYDSNLLSWQFPKRQDDSDGSIGAMVKAYSKISSSSTNTAYSLTYTVKDDKTDGGDAIRYYTKDDEKAKLTYEVKKTYTPDEVLNRPEVEPYGGHYSYLGINSKEIGNGDAFIESAAVYDLRKVQNPGDYIELTISLSQKDTYLTSAAGQPHASVTALDITKYISELTVYGKDTDGDDADDALYILSNDQVKDSTKASGLNRNSDSSGESVIVISDGSLNTAKDMITLRVHKSLLKTQGGENSNVYEIPISYSVITGDATFNAGTDGLKYSNYKVSVTAATYSDDASSIGPSYTTDQNYTNSSFAYNYLIYTNASIDPTVR